ncbi:MULTISPECIES: helix-turn-helix domain-containing protein [Streptomyces violaceusniger group]|uniref:Helix-turn-helix transcriptional regulator n=2 Tax=Streptomyces rhizosphaericus TaxID=114699 RepID=A0ABN1SJH4_9ACTN|nr:MULTISPECIES: helix-turn-helix transcriptional regulator [Streptomyces violaceusniger group]
MPDDAHIGARVRDIRKRRGLSQRELSVASDVSLSLIRKLEQGELRHTRLETAYKLARALRVTTTCLIQRDAEQADAATLDLWAGVRQALQAPPRTAPLEDEPTVKGVRATLDGALPLFSSDRFADLAEVLPQLIRDADAVAEAGADGRALRARLLQLTGWLLTQNRQYAAAAEALDRSLDEENDRLQGATTVSTQSWLLLRQGQLAQARELAVRWADEVEPRMSKATPAELSAWGWLLLRISAAAVRDHRAGEATYALRLARSAAVALDSEYAPGADFLRAFGPVTVALKRTENAAVSGKPDRVLKLAEGISKGGLRATSNNRNRHLLDVASAHATMRNYSESMSILSGINNSAPEWLSQQRYARDIMGQVIGRRRTLTPEMRSLADAVGLPM